MEINLIDSRSLTLCTWLSSLTTSFAKTTDVRESFGGQLDLALGTYQLNLYRNTIPGNSKKRWKQLKIHQKTSMKKLKRLFSGMLLGSLLLLISAVRLSGQCSILLSSETGTDNQTVCINTAITDITYIFPPWRPNVFQDFREGSQEAGLIMLWLWALRMSPVHSISL